MGEQRRGELQIRCCAIIAFALTGCAVQIPPPQTLLSEDETIDLLKHNRKWQGHIVTLTLYPFDRGYGRSNSGWAYPVCFEPCDRARADRSSFVVVTSEDRFKGFSGTRPVVVRARYDPCNVEWGPCDEPGSSSFVETE
jgi:hypothetical protein